MSDTKELAPFSPATVDASRFFSTEQTSLIKKQIAPKATDDELKLFLYQCARTGLDPMSRQIYCIHRPQYDPDTKQKVNKMTIQTSIDGLRLIAERTNRYAPGKEPTFEYDAQERLIKATAYVLKRTSDGTWHEVAASAHFLEYAQKKSDGTFTQMWQEKPHIMLAKCAEALALRKAFPAEMSNLYTGDEMGKADEPSYTPPVREVAASESPKASMTSSTTPSTTSQMKSSATSEAGATSTDREPGSDDDEEETDDPNDRVECLKWEKSSESWVAAGNESRHTPPQNRKFWALLRKCNISEADMHKRIVNLFGKESVTELSKREMGSLIDKMEQRVSKGWTPSAREAKWKADGWKQRPDGTWYDPSTGEVGNVA